MDVKRPGQINDRAILMIMANTRRRGRKRSAQCLATTAAVLLKGTEKTRLSRVRVTVDYAGDYAGV